MSSIKQNSNFTMQPTARLPDLRNLGVSLRILLLTNLMALIAAILRSGNLNEILPALAELSAALQPILLLSLLLLYVCQPVLKRLPYRWSVLVILALELLITSLSYYFAIRIFGLDSMPPLSHSLVLTLIITGILLGYFNLRQRALSPAVTEARLQALQARIRPHFLFNSINAVISMLRSDPKRAEVALMDMADLFRVLMADNRDLVPLAQELALCRQYLALEKIRLDERLAIEPMPEGGEITINIYAGHDQVHLLLTNPYRKQSEHHNGNKMALTNIRERLALHFDAEAQLTSKILEDSYQVHIVIPYHRNKAA